MKIRTDYVSNSSSSSFVIGNMFLFDYFHITKQDILDALIDMYGKEAYENAMKGYQKSAKDDPEYDAKELKYNKFGPFYVYDLSIPEERQEAIDTWGNLLEGWDASGCHWIRNNETHFGKVCFGGSGKRDYEEVIDRIANIYNVSRYDLNELAEGKTEDGYGNPIEVKKFVRSDKKDPETGCYGHYENLDDCIVDFVKRLRYDCGVMTNLDVIKSEVARFFVHADDNELPMGDDSEGDDKEKWDTDSWSYDRICEIVLKWLVKSGRVKPDDTGFMKEMEVDPKFLTKKEIADGEIYDFANGKTLTWRDIKNDSLTWNMHEG